MISSLGGAIFAALGLQKQTGKEPLNVVVTGAAGQIAHALYGYIGSGQIFGEDQPINLRLLDIEKCLKTLRGVELELQDCAYPILKSITITDDPNKAFADADVAIFLGGFPRLQGMERKDLLHKNNSIFEVQGQVLDKVARKTCRSVVVANPANTNCLTLARNAPSIPKSNFTCLTRLDHNRAQALLAQEAGVSVEKVKNVSIWGNHSTTQYPDFYNAKINGRPVTEVIANEVWLQNDFVKRVQKRGQEILEVKGLSSVMSAASAVKDHLRTWYFGTPEGEYTSMGVYIEGSPYGISNDLVFSLPVRCKGNFKYEIVKDVKLTQFAREKIALTEKELLEEKQLSSEAK